MTAAENLQAALDVLASAAAGLSARLLLLALSLKIADWPITLDAAA